MVIARNAVTLLTLTAFVMTTFGCSSTKVFQVSERDHIKGSQKIYKVETLDGTIIRFDSDPLGYAVLRDTVIDRFPADGSLNSIPLSSVKRIHTKEPDPVATVASIVVVTGVAALLVLGAIGHGLRSGSW